MTDLKNFEFEIISENRTMVLHMMDRAEKYIPRIAHPISTDGSFVQIHAPEGVPQEILQSLDSMIQQRMIRHFSPIDGLQGIVSIRLHDPYTIVFDLAKLWFEQRMDELQVSIISKMGLEDNFIELDWAEQMLDKDNVLNDAPENDKDKSSEL